MKSASDILTAAFDVEKLGEYPKAVYVDGSDPKERSEEAKDATKQKKWWKESLTYAGIGEGDTILKDWA